MKCTPVIYHPLFKTKQKQRLTLSLCASSVRQRAAALLEAVMLGAGVNLQGSRDASSSPTHCSFMFPWGQQPPRHSLGSLERGARSAGFMPPQRGPTCLCYLCSHTAPTPPSREQGLRIPRRLFFFSVNKARPLHAQDHSGKMLLPESGSLVRIIENFGSSVLVSALLNFMQVPGFTK